MGQGWGSCDGQIICTCTADCATVDGATAATAATSAAAATITAIENHKTPVVAEPKSQTQARGGKCALKVTLGWRPALLWVDHHGDIDDSKTLPYLCV